MGRTVFRIVTCSCYRKVVDETKAKFSMPGRIADSEVQMSCENVQRNLTCRGKKANPKEFRQFKKKV